MRNDLALASFVNRVYYSEIKDLCGSTCASRPKSAALKIYACLVILLTLHVASRYRIHTNTRQIRICNRSPKIRIKFLETLLQKRHTLQNMQAEILSPHTQSHATTSTPALEIHPPYNLPFLATVTVDKHPFTSNLHNTCITRRACTHLSLYSHSTSSMLSLFIPTAFVFVVWHGVSTVARLTTLLSDDGADDVVAESVVLGRKCPMLTCCIWRELVLMS